MQVPRASSVADAAAGAVPNPPSSASETTPPAAAVTTTPARPAAASTGTVTYSAGLRATAGAGTSATGIMSLAALQASAGSVLAQGSLPEDKKDMVSEYPAHITEEYERGTIRELSTLVTLVPLLSTECTLCWEGRCKSFADSAHARGCVESFLRLTSGIHFLTHWPTYFLQKLMQHPLLGEPWDSVRATSEVTALKLPDFSLDLERETGCNALVLRAKYFRLKGVDEFYMAVHVHNESVAGDNILLHGCLRGKYNTGSFALLGSQRKYVQGSRVNGRWISDSHSLRAEEFKIPEDTSFWWRLVFTPECVLGFLNGRLIMCTQYPETKRPREHEPMYMFLPVGGDNAERATWIVESAWWGFYKPSDKEREDAMSYIARKGLEPPRWFPTAVRVRVEPDSVALEMLRNSFVRYRVKEVVREEPGVYVVHVETQEAVVSLLREMDNTAVGKCRIRVGRILVDFRKNVPQLPPSLAPH
ncbi:MAG: hypothetical protein EOO65_01020 [Methanosarcinales archaeon]|nr:MAG: hypothetical protein EOO65_01020 [Methanosarcinales archaeon]